MGQSTLWHTRQLTIMKLLALIVALAFAVVSAEPEAKPEAKADPYWGYGGYYRGYYGGYPYGGYGWYRGKRSADSEAVAEPEANAEAKPYLWRLLRSRLLWRLLPIHLPLPWKTIC